MCVLLCFQLTGNVRFNWNMYNFKFNYLSRGQLVSLNLEKIFLPLLEISPCYESFLVTSFLPLLLEFCAEIISKTLKDSRASFQIQIKKKNKQQ